ncbi:DUF5375 family protein [Yersinia enterocolitica]|uniref:DUF5375 family protein n=1 Tax=Yersinia TaxID=629 RepID=UPI0005DCBC0A|nr:MULTISPECIES: DUF5375 family protein [Yersinia]EKN3343930.1 DUF5375 family protein [Yersinia enterocolitica]EKN4171391.1 DUF5375 family protein [Yersinia enterocolitica]EKN4881651.1 DUF5375 family protein [Yersinia enterocolitica]EKN5022887.1 hypothetical protein [Yersinia enterocolitica]EKN5066709.1 hypothetical protein [Yersinia enterocolitica]
MNLNNTSCIPLEVRTALYRRAVAQAYLDTCVSYGVALTMNIDELQMVIAENVEVYFMTRHGPESGMEAACCMLEDMVLPDILSVAPRLTLLGETMMDELCRAYIKTANMPVTLH